MSNLNILALYAHTADTATEASGTLALHAEHGDNVTSIITSFGERHHTQLFHDEEQKPPSERDPAILNISMEEYKAFKQREAERIADILGISQLIFLGWPDYGIELTQERVSEMTNLILRIKPDIIITHMPIAERAAFTDDHAIVSHIVWHAILGASNTIRQFDGVEPYHGVKQIFWFPMGGQADSRFFLNDGIICDVWIDITPVIHKKVQAMDQLVSQGYQGTAARKVAEARDGRCGMLAGCSYAEPFLRPMGLTYDLLPMSERVLNRRFVPNDLPGDEMIAYPLPSATPADAFRVRP